MKMAGDRLVLGAAALENDTRDGQQVTKMRCLRALSLLPIVNDAFVVQRSVKTFGQHLALLF